MAAAATLPDGKPGLQTVHSGSAPEAPAVVAALSSTAPPPALAGSGSSGELKQQQMAAVEQWLRDHLLTTLTPAARAALIRATAMHLGVDDAPAPAAASAAAAPASTAAAGVVGGVAAAPAAGAGAGAGVFVAVPRQQQPSPANAAQAFSVLYRKLTTEPPPHIAMGVAQPPLDHSAGVVSWLVRVLVAHGLDVNAPLRTPLLLPIGGAPATAAAAAAAAALARAQPAHGAAVELKRPLQVALQSPSYAAPALVDALLDLTVTGPSAAPAAAAAAAALAIAGDVGGPPMPLVDVNATEHGEPFALFSALSNGWPPDVVQRIAARSSEVALNFCYAEHARLPTAADVAASSGSNDSYDSPLHYAMREFLRAAAAAHHHPRNNKPPPHDDAAVYAAAIAAAAQRLRERVDRTAQCVTVLLAHARDDGTGVALARRGGPEQRTPGQLLAAALSAAQQRLASEAGERHEHDHATATRTVNAATHSGAGAAAQRGSHARRSGGGGGRGSGSDGAGADARQLVTTLQAMAKQLASAVHRVQRYRVLADRALNRALMDDTDLPVSQGGGGGTGPLAIPALVTLVRAYVWPPLSPWAQADTAPVLAARFRG